MPPQPAPFDAGRLKALSSAYWQACALHAAVQTGILAALAAGPASAAQLAAQLELDGRGSAILLTGLEALGLLRSQEGVYALDPAALPFLTPGSPKDMTNAILHMADMVADWAKLADCVRTGRPVERPKDDQGAAQARGHFYRAMRDIARQQAQGLAARLGLAAGQHLLDLGGGPGVYALTFAEETPGLACTVQDLPGAAKFLEEEKALHPQGRDRVAFREGSYEEAPLGGPYDVVWLSQVLHGEGPQACRRLLAKAAQALRPGGVLWVQEFVVQTPGGHPWPALFSINMLVNTPEGQGYDAAQLRAMLEQAGLVDVELTGPTQEGSPASLLRGRRPA